VTIDISSVAEVAAAKARQKRRRRASQLRLAIVFIGCGLLLDAVFGDRGFLQGLKSREELVRARQDVAEWKRQNAALRTEIRRLQEDPGALEWVARQELGLLRRGEILVVLSEVK
jgi:cell division protein FtsB